MKHAEQPEKFIDSEVDLDEHIKSLLQVCALRAGPLRPHATAAHNL